MAYPTMPNSPPVIEKQAKPTLVQKQAKPTVPFEPPLILHETEKPVIVPGRCHQDVGSIVFPNPTATEQPTTSYFVNTVCDPASTKTPRKSTTTSSSLSSSTTSTTMSTVVSTTSSITLSTSPATSTITPLPASVRAKRPYSREEIAAFAIGGVAGLVALIIIAFLLRRCFLKRKEAHHDKTSTFWRRIFGPSQATNGDVNLSGLPPPATAPSSSFPRSYKLSPTNPYTATDPKTGFPSTGQAIRQAPPPPSKLSHFKSTLKDKAHLTSSKINRFPLSRATEIRATAREQARAREAAAELQDRVNNVDAPPSLGLGLGSDSMVEICLDEDVALEEQEKADNRRIDELAEWTAKKKSYSPYPLPFGS